MTDRFIPSNCESCCYAVKITKRELGEEKKEIGGGEVEHILSLSYGKDSLACLGAIEELGWPMNRIIHAEVWVTDTIQADLPPIMGKRVGQMVGWPMIKGCDIQSSCKSEPLAKATKGAISYWGIAADEPNRIKKHKSKPNVRMPLRMLSIMRDEANELSKVTAQLNG